jgi:K+-sensing histidine kinase KdpD
MIARLNLILANVSLAVLAVAVFQRLLGFPPLVLFVVAVAIVLRVSGFVAALAAVAGAAVGDYFFVGPIGRFTVHAEGLRLLLLLLLGAAAVRVMTPPGSLRKPGQPT